MSSVLIIDDNTDTAQGMQLLFKRRGHEATAIYDGWAALLWLSKAKSPPDVIVLDWMMAEIDGGHVLRAIRSEPRLESVAVVVFSAASDRVADAIALGATAYIVKGSMSWDTAARNIEWLLRRRAGGGSLPANFN